MDERDESVRERRVKGVLHEWHEFARTWAKTRSGVLGLGDREEEMPEHEYRNPRRKNPELRSQEPEGRLKDQPCSYEPGHRARLCADIYES